MERYKSLVPKYSRGASAAVVVFDVSDPISFRAAQSLLDEAISNAGEGLIPFLVGNKIDLGWIVEEAEALEFALTHSAEFLSVSAKTGDNISDLFEVVAMRVREIVTPCESDLPGVLQESLTPTEPQTRICC
jgi:GTPase SAR1 family protein